jgi:amino acid transporter
MSEYPADRVPGAGSNRAAADGGTPAAILTPLAQQYLDQTRPWVRLMSVIVFVSAGLMVLVGISMLLVVALGGFRAMGNGEPGPLGSATGFGVMALVYVLLAFVYVAPGLYLSRYASAIRRLKVNSTAAGLEDTLKHQKSFWRFIGIMAVIGIAIGVVVIGLAVVAGAIGAMMAAQS